MAKPRASWRILAGILAGFAVPLLLAEIDARVRPPADVWQYLGESSPLTGHYRPDATLGADYKTYRDFQADYKDRLNELGPLDSPQPTWVWFGNSFVQAPGMLGDTARDALPAARMFYLRRNETINLRAAQARLFLENGLRPERIIFTLLPIDMAAIGGEPFSSIMVTRRGAITYRVRMPPGPLGILIRHSKLAQLSWVRSGWAAAEPNFHAGEVNSFIRPSLAADLRTLTGMLGELSKKYGTKVTVLLIPNREQILGKAGFALQDAVAGMCGEAGIDCYDARHIFTDAPDKPSLFLPDWHFTPRGNQMLFAGLQTHFDAMRTNTGGATK